MRTELKNQIRETAEALAGILEFDLSDLERIIRYWTRRIPDQEREDLLQGLAIKLLEARPDTLGLTFSLAKGYTMDWLRKWYVRQHVSLDLVIDAESKTTLGDVIADEVQYEAITIGKIDAARLWQQIPKYERAIVVKKLQGKRLSKAEDWDLNHFAKKHLDLVYAC